MTMVAEIERLVDGYRHWLKEKTSVREIDDSWVEITTPYIDRHNDMLQIYAKRADRGYILSDDSHIIHDLEASGCSLKSARRQDLLKMTLRGFGIKLNRDALEVNATAETFPARKHSLVQAMLAVNDLFYLAQPVVESLFLEDVTSWLNDSNVRYTPNIKLTGTSGYDHRFHFVIPRFKKQPERIVEAINRPTKDSVAEFIFRWNDTREARSAESQAYAILNDRDQMLSSAVADALTNYGIHPVPWSTKRDVEANLAA